MKAPFFTVLIDTYNYGEFIEEAVSSVLAQDFPAAQREILVVDDGSTDDTPQRLQKYKGEILYLRKQNGGQASAFNYGFEHARGEVIALLDADDIWLPEKLGRVYEEFKRHPGAGIVYHRTHLWSGSEDISEDGYFIPVSGNVTESKRALLQYPMVGTSCLAFKREALQKLLPVPESLRFQADAYLTALIIFVAPVVAVTEFLGKYRLHGADLNSADMRAYLTQWVKSQERDGFALRTPSRWKYFRHLLDFPLTYREIMTPRHRTYTYIRAFAALLLGYHHLHLLDDLRMKRKQVFTSSVEQSLAPEKEKAFAAKG